LSPRFEARIEAAERGGHLVALPFTSKAAFGKTRAPVLVTVNGHRFRTTTMRYGITDYIGLNREVRAAAQLDEGDRAAFDIELDAAPREVDVPAELAKALAKDSAARAAYAELSFTHRKEYAAWIAGAKREETRTRRVEKAVEMLRSGVRTPD
jgi:hypothetical protein